jgi:hypothetical protein
MESLLADDGHRCVVYRVVLGLFWSVVMAFRENPEEASLGCRLPVRVPYVGVPLRTSMDTYEIHSGTPRGEAK